MLTIDKTPTTWRDRVEDDDIEIALCVSQPGEPLWLLCSDKRVSPVKVANDITAHLTQMIPEHFGEEITALRRIRQALLA